MLSLAFLFGDDNYWERLMRGILGCEISRSNEFALKFPVVNSRQFRFLNSDINFKILICSEKFYRKFNQLIIKVDD